MITKISRLATAALAVALAVGLLGMTPAQGTINPDIGFLTGQVTVDGKPQRASIYIYSKPATTAGWIEDTDENGYFTLSDAQLTSRERKLEWFIQATPLTQGLTTYSGNTGRKVDAKRINFVPGTTVTANIALVVDAAITGRVVDGKGRPVKGVRVGASEGVTLPSSLYYPEVRTDAEGRYTIRQLRPGPVTVEVLNHRSFEWTEPRSVVEAVRGTTVTAPDLVVNHHLKDGKLTAKISRVKKKDEIWIFDTKTRDAHQLHDAIKHKKSWKKGTATVTATLRPGTYRLVIGGTNVASKEFTVKPGKTAKVPRFKGPKSRTALTGKVREADGKRTKSGFVSVTDAYGIQAAWVAVKKGTYKATGLGKGYYDIVDFWSGAKASVVISKSKATKNLRKKARTSLSGTVTHNSQPVEGVKIFLVDNLASGCVVYPEPSAVKKRRARNCMSLFDSLAETDAEGRYTLEDVPVGTHRFVVSDPYEGGFKTVIKEIKVPKAGKAWDVKLSM